ncbi:unnamed protein product [Rhizoctonia solani]|uniref:ATPase AAA-type core domain-containing protein n=1 Tax=Rhizoctonia solani TaxID=456999 RepID=A0A8H3DSY1_9AGAM|nr:unnamed protein product [Rhizoctonia solani]
MSASTIKKFTSQLRSAPNSSDHVGGAPPQGSDKGFGQLDSEVRVRALTTPEGEPNTTSAGGVEVTPQVPRSYYLGFKSCNQFWDQGKDQWTETYRVAPPENPPISNRIMAYNRKNSALPHNNHIWIEIRGDPLLELLRPHFQGFSAFTGVVSGIDARHIYMQRKTLEALIPRSTKSQALTSVDKIMYTDLQHLLDYIEEEFADVTLELDHMKQEEDPHIRWDLLWALFTPGELLETKESLFSLDMAFKPKSWLYSATSLDSPKPDPNQHAGSSVAPSNLNVKFRIEGEFLEWTGQDDKQFIKALVEARATTEGAPIFEDVVPGKGGGLVMLFHGGTAEAISEHLQLPLYKVTSEDLHVNPSSPEKVEVRLKRILEISSLWKAIVLIDEADEFIKGRSAASYGQNGASSSGAFLRLLEYHSGIVILTTNYFGAIDAAVRSRINFALRYKNLDSASRRILWKKVQRLSLAGVTVQNPDKPGVDYDFSQEELSRLAARDTNGRDIKNTVQTAQAATIAHRIRY